MVSLCHYRTQYITVVPSCCRELLVRYGRRLADRSVGRCLSAGRWLTVCLVRRRAAGASDVKVKAAALGRLAAGLAAGLVVPDITAMPASG